MADSNSQNSGVKRSATASPSRNDGGAHDANHASSQNQESSENQKKHRGRPRVGSHHPIAVVGVHGQNSIRAAFGTPLSPKKPTAKVACPQCTLENSSSATTCRVCDGALSGQLVPCITCHHLAPSLLPTPAPCCRHRPPPPLPPATTATAVAATITTTRLPPQLLRDVAWRGVAWRGVAWRGVAWRGVAWRGVAWRGVAWCGMAWRGVA